MRRLIPTAIVAALLLELLLHVAPAAREAADRFGAAPGASYAQAAHARAALPAPPPGWPATLGLGMSDHPDGAASMRATAPFAFRYQYLAGGANTNSGWATWNDDGHFATYYVRESVERGMTPVFTYYMIRQSAPGMDVSDEPDAVLGNLQNVATVRAYFDDLALFFRRAGAFPSTRVVLHVEPDMWGYAQQRATDDDAATVLARVAATGHPDLAGLPDTVAGVARAVVRLRDRYAPNVQLGYHVSVWGTRDDIVYSNPSNATVDALATRSAAFYRSLGVDFDLLFAEFGDRDAAFKEHVYGDGGASWWDDADFDRNVRYVAGVVAGTGRRAAFWQIPYGNTKMRAQNNTRGHYQDNKVERLLDDPARVLLRRYADAGVLAFLFGGGAGGVTCACDAEEDGTTDPAPINGNTRASLSADDDGGYFRDRAAAYYRAGPLALPSGAVTPPGPPPSPTLPPVSPTPTVPPVPPTPTLPPTPSVSCSPRPAFTIQAAPAPGGELRVTIAAGVTAGAPNNTVRAVQVGQASNARVDVAGRGLVANGQLIQLAAGTRQLSLVVRRAQPGAATTVPLVLTDDCGAWQTLVGGGPRAF